MVKDKKIDLKLLVKPIDNKPFCEWDDFVWATSKEMNDYHNKGYKRVKNIKVKI